MTKRTIDQTNREPKRSRFVRFGAIFFGLVLLFSQSACISIDLLGDGESWPLVESRVAGKRGPKILMIEIDGLISGSEVDSGYFGLGTTTSMVGRVREMLDRAREDDDVQGILLRIDSPGGTATASEQIYTEIVRFKEERNVPVVAQLLTTAASGGYYIAMSADAVQAHPTTVVGSIGVIFSSMNFAGLMDKLGIEDQTITGGEFKDMGSPYRPLTGGERGQLQAIVDDLHARFKEVVDLGRPKLTAEQVEVVADGRIYSARQALANGMVDRIGTLNEAVGYLSDKMSAPRVQVVAYHRPSNQRRNFYMKSFPAAPSMSGAGMSFGPASMATALADLLRKPGFHYLWWPGLAETR